MFPCQDIRARGLKAQVSSLDDFDFEELPNQKIATWPPWPQWDFDGDFLMVIFQLFMGIFHGDISW